MRQEKIIRFDRFERDLDHRHLLRDGGPSDLVVPNGSWPAISPDGKFIAYAVGGEANADEKGISFMPINDALAASRSRLPLTGISYNRFRWSPDGHAIISKDFVSGLWRQPIVGGEPSRIAGSRAFAFTISGSGRTGRLSFPPAYRPERPLSPALTAEVLFRFESHQNGTITLPDHRPDQ